MAFGRCLKTPNIGIVPPRIIGQAKTVVTGAAEQHPNATRADLNPDGMQISHYFWEGWVRHGNLDGLVCAQRMRRQNRITRCRIIGIIPGALMSQSEILQIQQVWQKPKESDNTGQNQNHCRYGS